MKSVLSTFQHRHNSTSLGPSAFAAPDKNATVASVIRSHYEQDQARRDDLWADRVKRERERAYRNGRLAGARVAGAAVAICAAAIVCALGLSHVLVLSV
jgi:hypothetical protein